ncbi:heterokaryon incompatibility protein-domain-containing protein [Pisolithus tinctorius]|nr:heterokaryon incompatibility protein-domain-containing protein [Pisolithus tinctorius]
MLLLNVNAVLERDRAIEGDVTSTTTKVLEECDDAKTPYAILSHRWQKEVDHNEMMNLVEMEKAKPKEVSQKNGYKKILGACKQAVKDDLEWLWVDTCCIDKRSSSELSEAINSMYRWYENSTKCYAYLYDVDDRIFPTEPNLERFDKYKGWPEWFSRGWTLQELIAPKDIQFFNKEWAPIGNKRDLADTLEKITRISKDILISGLDSGVRSAAQIMSWAADRETARVEDRAYSLLGLFGVHMPMVYGEGKSAFQRLQLEIIRSSNDHSIFAWDPKGRVRRCGSILADDPNYFRDCDGIWSVEPEWFVQRFKSHIRDHVARHVVPTKSRMQSAVLIMRKRPHIKELSTCSIASGGLQVSLPVAPYPGSSPLFRVTLGCVASLVGPLMTIDLMSDSTHYYRFFGATGEPTKLPRVEQLFLSCDQGESRRSLRLDDRTVSFYGFKRCSTFPHSIVGNSVKLSLMNDLIVVIYTNKAGVRFALGLGHYLGSAWTHTICDESRSQTCMSWESCDGCRSQTSTSREGCNECRSRTCMSCESYAKEAHDSMWSRQADLALACNNKKSDHGDTTHTNPDTASFIKHAHLPRSIWAARTTWGVWYRGNCTVTIDILVCTGCCRGPLALETSTADWSGIETPGLMRQAVNPSSHIYALYMDGTKTHLLHFTGIEDVQLGDYGHCDPTFKCDGNIFQDLAAPDPAGSKHHDCAGFR